MCLSKRANFTLLLGKLREFMAGRGLILPEICTPIELMGE
jgi:hypothetical protein